ncbi:MAG: DegQ family serine endoprotease [Gammaproteobacteria bacterium]
MKDRLFGAGVALFLVITATIALHAQEEDATREEAAALSFDPVPTLAPIIERVSPAVVNIATRGSVEVQGQTNPLFEDPFFRRFFDLPEQFGPRERRFQAAGSGVIVDAENGYIVTNAHVVANADEITVTLRDNRDIQAELVGADAASDVALLKTEADNLTEIPLADSGKARVGDFVVAIGNPFGLQHTVTSGIISALGRSGINPAGAQAYEDFIQTDASINPGNSGGALVNLRGELVGINSAIFTRSGGNIGIGFAIPSAMVRNVMEQLIEFGEVQRGLLGVQITPINSEIAEALGIDVDDGALVSQVVSGSGADEAGIETGDVIVAVDGRRINDANELRNVIGMHRAGADIEIEVIRGDGDRKTVTATLGEQVQDEPVVAQEIHRGLEGAELATVDESSPAYQGTTGVLITSVAPGSPAFLNSLRQNDVITHVNRQRVNNLNEFRLAAEGADALVLALQRGDSNVLIPLR